MVWHLLGEISKIHQQGECERINDNVQGALT